MSGIIKGISLMMGIPIRWGGDWQGDMTFNRNIHNPLNDLDHYELVKDGPSLELIK